MIFGDHKLEVWRVVFFSSLLMSSIVMALVFPEVFTQSTTTELRVLPLVVSGLFVGFGTSLGNGCTSGHGVCGLGRFSKRSLFATCDFFLVSIIISIVTRQLLSESLYTTSAELEWLTKSYDELMISIYALTALLATYVGYSYAQDSTNSLQPLTAAITTVLTSILMSVGLGISQMTSPVKIRLFLDFLSASDSQEGWDPSLGFVFLGAVMTTVIGFRFVLPPALGKPLIECNFDLPKSNEITTELGVGMFLFGFGWGLGGLCPGPALVGLASGRPIYFIFVIAMVIGQFLHQVIYVKMTAKNTPSQAAGAGTTRPNTNLAVVSRDAI